MEWVTKWHRARRERKLHNDRDFACKYWWGDRGGFGHHADERCYICRPKQAE